MGEVLRNKEDIINEKSDDSEDIIFIKAKSFDYLINQEEIIYIECMNKILTVNTIHGSIRIKNLPLSKLSKKLSDQFVQCHKSFIVNLNYIITVDKANSLINLRHCSTTIPIGRKYKDHVSYKTEK